MVPAEEVEEAVCEQHRDLVEQARTALRRLFPGGWNAHDDIPQDRPGELGELALLHRERKDVGRAIFISIDFVQLMDALVVR